MRIPRPRLRRKDKDATAIQPEPAPGGSDGEAPAAVAKPAKGPAPGESPANLDGLRAWVAQLDRKLGTRFYALAAGTVLALAAGIVGIVLALGVKDDAATKGELGALREEVTGVEQSATEAAQAEVAELAERLDQLEAQFQNVRSSQGSTEREISVLQDDISDLRSDISELRRNPPDDDSP